MTALAAPASLPDTATSVAYVRGGSERDGYGLLCLGSPDALEASFAPQVGMTCCSVRHRGDELLGERHGLAAYASCGITMGMSMMHPGRTDSQAGASPRTGRRSVCPSSRCCTPTASACRSTAYSRAAMHGSCSTAAPLEGRHGSTRCCRLTAIPDSSNCSRSHTGSTSTPR